MNILWHQSKARMHGDLIKGHNDAPHLVLPQTRTELAKRAFAVAAPVIWNSLPAALRYCQTVLTFKIHLKTDYVNG